MRQKILQVLALSLIMAAFMITTPHQASAFFLQQEEVEEKVEKEVKEVEGRVDKEARSAAERGRKAANEAEREARRSGEKAKEAGREGRERAQDARREGRERAQEARRDGQERAQEARREGQERAQEARREGRERAEDARGEMESRRDSARNERGRRVSEEEREARRDEMGDRVNDRIIRGRDMTPEQLQTQLAEAKQKEIDRHEARMARIEEISGHASAEGNEAAVERAAALMNKEKALHEKKLGKIAEMEKRYARKLEKQVKADQ